MFFPRKCGVLGGQEEKKEEKGKGEGRRRKEEEREDRVFLTFRMVKGRGSAAPGSVMTLEGDLCSSVSNFVRDVASKMYVFQLENSMVHEIRTLMLEGPNFVKFFLFLILKNITFSPKKRQGPIK